MSLLVTKNQITPKVSKKNYGLGQTTSSCSNVQLPNNSSFHRDLLIIQQFPTQMTLQCQNTN